MIGKNSYLQKYMDVCFFFGTLSTSRPYYCALRLFRRESKEKEVCSQQMVSKKCVAGTAVALLAGVALAQQTPSCTDKYPQSAAFFGAMGCASALVFANLGSAYGTAKSGIGLAHLGILHSERIMRGIRSRCHGWVSWVSTDSLSLPSSTTTSRPTRTPTLPSLDILHFGAGLASGLSSLAAGLAIGIVGDTSVRAYGKQEKIFVAMILMLIFAEALGLYGLIIALLMNNNANKVTVGGCN